MFRGACVAQDCCWDGVIEPIMGCHLMAVVASLGVKFNVNLNVLTVTTACKELSKLAMC